MNDVVAIQADAVPSSPEKTQKTGKTRGAKVNPNSKASQTKIILANIPASELTRARALEELAKLGLSEKVASVYYYNYKPKTAAVGAISA
jgi:hypothetical protein